MSAAQGDDPAGLPRHLHAHLSRAALIPPEAHVLVAVSGGVDSVALLHLLAASPLGLTLTVFHLDHGLRAGGEADARLVAEAAGQLGLEAILETLPPGWASADAPGQGIQAAARARRYARLEAARARVGAQLIATGHTRSDQAETVLGRALRGAGLAGLAGIPARRGVIVRPLLPFGREEVLTFAREAGLRWREDPSNADPRYERARLRHQLLPLARAAVNPRAEEALAHLATVARRDEDFLEAAVDAALAAASLPADAAGPIPRRWLADQHPAIASRILMRMMAAAGDVDGRQGRLHLEAALAFLPGEAPALSLPGGRLLREAGGCVTVARPPAAAAAAGEGVPLAIPGLTCLPRAGIVVEGTAPFKAPPARLLAVSADRCLLDAQVATRGLSIRFRQPGDRFHPFGAPGSKKLNHFFIDSRIPRDERDRIPLVCLGDTILWVVGVRASELGRLTAASEQVVELRAMPAPSRGLPERMGGTPHG